MDRCTGQRVADGAADEESEDHEDSEHPCARTERERCRTTGREETEDGLQSHACSCCLDDSGLVHERIDLVHGCLGLATDASLADGAGELATSLFGESGCLTSQLDCCADVHVLHGHVGHLSVTVDAH